MAVIVGFACSFAVSRAQRFLAKADRQRAGFGVSVIRDSKHNSVEARDANKTRQECL